MVTNSVVAQREGVTCLITLELCKDVKKVLQPSRRGLRGGEGWVGSGGGIGGDGGCGCTAAAGSDVGNGGDAASDVIAVLLLEEIRILSSQIRTKTQGCLVLTIQAYGKWFQVIGTPQAAWVRESMGGDLPSGRGGISLATMRSV